jgi:hypothetical protein
MGHSVFGSSVKISFQEGGCVSCRGSHPCTEVHGYLIPIQESSALTLTTMFRARPYTGDRIRPHTETIKFMIAPINDIKTGRGQRKNISEKNDHNTARFQSKNSFHPEKSC